MDQQGVLRNPNCIGSLDGYMDEVNICTYSCPICIQQAPALPHSGASVLFRRSSTFGPTITSRTLSTSAITAMMSTHGCATLSSDTPSSTSPSTCSRRSSGCLTNPACTIGCTLPNTARRWVHWELLALHQRGSFQHPRMSAQTHFGISVTTLHYKK